MACLREFPENARQDAGYKLDQVQRGKQPTSSPFQQWAKVQKLRVRDDSETYRVMYVARLCEAVYVLHALQKKTRSTSKQDIENATH